MRPKPGSEDVLSTKDAERVRVAEEIEERRLGRRLTMIESLQICVRVLDANVPGKKIELAHGG